MRKQIARKIGGAFIGPYNCGADLGSISERSTIIIVP